MSSATKPTPTTASILRYFEGLSGRAQECMPLPVADFFQAKQSPKEPIQASGWVEARLPEQKMWRLPVGETGVVRLQIQRGTSARCSSKELTRDVKLLESLSVDLSRPIVVHNPTALKHGKTLLSQIADCFVSVLIDKIEFSETGVKLYARKRFFGIFTYRAESISFAKDRWEAIVKGLCEHRDSLTQREREADAAMQKLHSIAFAMFPLPIIPFENLPSRWLREAPWPSAVTLGMNAHYKIPAVMEHRSGDTLEAANLEIACELSPLSSISDVGVAAKIRAPSATVHRSGFAPETVDFEGSTHMTAHLGLVPSLQGAFTGQCTGPTVRGSGAGTFASKIGLFTGLSIKWIWTEKPQLTPRHGGREVS